VCLFVYLFACLLTGSTLVPSRSSVKLGAPISRSGALRWLGFSTSRPLGCVLLYFVSASSFVCCCRLRDCSQVQYSLALGYSRARIRRRTVHFWRSASSALDCFAATSLVAFALATLILGLSGPRPLQRLPCVVVGYSSLGAWPLPRFADPSLWFPRARPLFNTDFLAFILSVCMCVCSVIIHRYSNPSALGRSSARLLRFSATACARPIRHHSPLALGVPLRSAAPAPDRSVGAGSHRVSTVPGLYDLVGMQPRPSAVGPLSLRSSSAPALN